MKKIKFILLILTLGLSACSGSSTNSSPDGAGGSTNPPLTAVYVFQSDSITAANVGSETVTAARCSNAFATIHTPSVTCSTFHGLVGYSANNGLLNFATNKGINSSRPVNLIDGTQISPSFSQFISNPPPHGSSTLFTGWTDFQWWSGVNSDGSLANNCLDWTSNSASQGGRRGRNQDVGNADWSVGTTLCDYYDDFPHLCICY